MGAVLRMDWSTFTSGRLTTDLGLRQGAPIYKSAALDCDNYVPVSQGPLVKRPGINLIQRLDVADGGAILPFNFSYVQAYAMVFGTDGNLRIYLADTPGSAPVATLSHPYSSADLKNLKWTQSFDTMFIFHPSYPEQRLVRGGSHTAWSFSTIPWGAGSFPPQYRFADTAGITLTPSAASGSITLTASASLFDSTWVGLWLRMADGYVHIDSITSDTVANGTVPASDLFVANNTNYTSRYNLKFVGAISDWTEQATSARRGYARCGSFYQGRLIFGGTRDLPQTLFASRTNSFYDHNPNFDVVVESGVLTQDNVHDDDAWSFTLSSQQSHTIESVFGAAGALQIFTREGEWTDQSAPITPSNVSLQPTSNEGTLANGPQVTQAQGYSIFVDRTGKNAFSYSYQYANQNYLPSNISLISNHTMLTSPNSGGRIRNLLGSGVSLGMYCNGTPGTANFGKIITVTFDPQNSAMGWSRWTSSLFNFTYMMEVANRIYVTMKRISDNATFLGWIETDSDAGSQKFLDLAQTQTLGSPGIAFTGFTNFANTSITVVADAFYVYSNIAVDGSGNFTLPDARTSVIAGYPYPDRFESMPAAPVINGMLGRGGHITIKRTTAWIQNAPGVYINGRLVRPRSIPEVVLGQTYSVDLNKIYEVESAHFATGTEPTTVIQSMQGFPCTINGVVVDFQLGRST